MNSRLACLLAGTLLLLAAERWLRPQQTQESQPPVGPDSHTLPAEGAVDEPSGVPEVVGLAQPPTQEASEAISDTISSGATIDPADETLTELADLDSAEVARQLCEISTAQLQTEATQMLVRRWVKLAPTEALAWIAQLADNPARRSLESAAILSWAGQDPAGALQLALTLPAGNDRDRLTIELGGEMLREDPIATIELARSLTPTQERNELIVRAAAQWADVDESAALAWSRQISEASLRERVLAHIALGWSEKNPESAATLAATELAPGRLQADTVVAIVQRWVQQSPQGATAWVAQFNDGPLFTAAVENLVKIWAEQSREQIDQWIRELPASVLRDKASSVLALQVLPKFQEDPGI